MDISIFHFVNTQILCGSLQALAVIRTIRSASPNRASCRTCPAYASFPFISKLFISNFRHYSPHCPYKGAPVLVLPAVELVVVLELATALDPTLLVGGGLLPPGL
jgi:hypothetical protein